MPRRSIKEKRWIRGFIVAFLAITATILLIAQPVAMAADRLVVDAKDGDKVKKMEIWHDSDMANVTAIVDGQTLKVTERKTFPIALGPHLRKIVAIHPGPVIVFEGSTCIWIPPNRWIAYPPGTRLSVRRSGIRSGLEQSLRNARLSAGRYFPWSCATYPC